MSPPLRYFPAYLGLFASLTLAMACNAFLDIGYGSFTTEVVIWGFAMAFTLGIGWRQQGELNDKGKVWQRSLLVLSIPMMLICFLPIWGLPRAGVYFLAMLQTAINCATTTRRQLHFGLLVSLVMVVFSATHYRADWTMLFYLVPYVVAVVFTLVADQINRRLESLQQQSRGSTVAGGQGAAIFAATACILLLSALLYSVTPQVTWPYLSWKYGQTSQINMHNGTPGGAGGDEKGGGGSGGTGTGQADGSSGGFSPDPSQLPNRDWPTPEDMRKAAKRPGMPQWQSQAIRSLADLTEGVTKILQPLTADLKKNWESFKQWMKQHRDEILKSLLGLIVLALLAALIYLLREARAGLWIRTRFDYLRFVALGTTPAQQVLPLYAALERLFTLYQPARPATANTREQLAQLIALRSDLRQEWIAITDLFERVRYGATGDNAELSAKMRDLYRRAYQHLE